MAIAVPGVAFGIAPRELEPDGSAHRVPGNDRALDSGGVEDSEQRLGQRGKG